MLHVPAQGNALPFEAPAGLCCNCGTKIDVKPKQVRLKKTRYFLFAGVEWTFLLDLPFCRNCAGTANRLRQGLFSKAMMIFGLTFALFLALTFVPGLPMTIVEHLFLVSLSASAALVIGFHAMRRARPPMTSVYQPVFLQKLQQSFGGQVECIELGFTNSAYAALFKEANRAACTSGLLKVAQG